MGRISILSGLAGLALSAATFGISAHAQPYVSMMSGGYGPGYGMTAGYGPNCYGPAMMYGGCNAPGYMMGNGPGYGPRMGYGPGYGPNGLNLSSDDVRDYFARWIAAEGNSHLKVGEVKEENSDTIIADIVTQDNSLVQQFVVDRHNGFYRPQQVGSGNAASPNNSANPGNATGQK